MLKHFLALSLAVFLIPSLQTQSEPDINKATLAELNPTALTIPTSGRCARR